jgi:hypothetical protein
MQQQEADGLTGGGATLAKSMTADVLPFTPATLDSDTPLNTGVLTHSKLKPHRANRIKM